MKLPEYDNRPPPHTPLYENEDESSWWEDIKFPVMGIGLPLLAIALLISSFYGFIDAIRELLR